MTVEDLQRKIGELNKQINDEVARNPAPRTNDPSSAFPSGTWILAIVCFAWAFGGDQVDQIKPYVEMSWMYVAGLGALLALAALVRSILWIFKSRPKSGKEYTQNTSKVRELQAQKRELQQKLKELEEE